MLNLDSQIRPQGKPWHCMPRGMCPLHCSTSMFSFFLWRILSFLELYIVRLLKPLNKILFALFARTCSYHAAQNTKMCGLGLGDITVQNQYRDKLCRNILFLGRLFGIFLFITFLICFWIPVTVLIWSICFDIFFIALDLKNCKIFLQNIFRPLFRPNLLLYRLQK